MGNMSYCRFENTLRDLRDCHRHLPNQNLSRNEAYSFMELVSLCREIADEYDGYNEDDLLETSWERYADNDDLDEDEY
jgi:hypothetical protein